MEAAGGAGVSRKHELQRELRAIRKRERTIKNKALALPENSKPDRGRERDPAFLQWLRRLPCYACMVRGGYCGPTHAAHIRFSRPGTPNPGLQCKSSDRRATPLGEGCHLRDQHARSERGFWAELNTDPDALAAELYRAFNENASGEEVLGRFAAEARRAA